MNTYIELNNMSFYAYHGVLPQETITGNKFEVNLKLKYDFTDSFDTDDVRDTISYADVYDIVKREMQIPSKLLEHVAGRIFNSLKEEFEGITIIELRVSKLNPPVNGEVAKADIIITE
ncbi:MAG: dihydroneopterin aldolase [Proteiniphilum sp.]|nr:dihydroneopterin aldolase [Proteiniphilum sp.]